MKQSELVNWWNWAVAELNSGPIKVKLNHNRKKSARQGWFVVSRVAATIHANMDQDDTAQKTKSIQVCQLMRANLNWYQYFCRHKRIICSNMLNRLITFWKHFSVGRQCWRDPAYAITVIRTWGLHGDVRIACMSLTERIPFITLNSGMEVSFGPPIFQRWGHIFWYHTMSVNPCATCSGSGVPCWMMQR